ncbi:hypothetical protein H2198_008056 [Neophaeococcomyces mojaviensis]|uniref:Uncharacterized protein n=1 Tax=Neophaeococcomyces mojaviensis TaxID=3383035 RepID=A0ACC2ZYF1_9EURO|nr:hypothetical protein H2198_008056 [Knufia sp. JES_112]
MAPVTDFAVKEKYGYLSGFGSYHSSEAFPDANPLVINSPQKPPYGLRTERISGTSFTAPRSKNLQTWMYRTTSSLVHTEFELLEEAQPAPSSMTPNGYMWPSFSVDKDTDWTRQKLLARNGDPADKRGTAIWVFAVTKNMEDRNVFSSLDGDQLIIVQAGALDIQTELGKLLVRQNEIAMIPRGIRYQVTLATPFARGYVCELFQGHWDLPELGPIGSTGLANVRDFQIPSAYYDGKLENGVAKANNAEWTIVSRMNGQLWACTQDHTPFDVAAWHGTYYPFKYDLARYCVMGNVLFDEHDPSLYAVLSATTGDNPGASACDFLIIPPRWQATDAFWLPYYHRNTHSEFYGPIINRQDPEFPPNKGLEFKPFGAGLNGPMTTHGPSEEDFQKASNMELKPAMLQNEGVTVFLLETEKPLYLSDWATKAALKNFGGKPRPKI